MGKALLIIDGAADERYNELNGLSPLEYAQTPNLEKLRQNSRFINVKTIPDGATPGTDAAFLNLLGANAINAGRAYIEAAGMGIEIKSDEQAVRINLACIQEHNIASHCGDDISDEEASELIDFIVEDSLIKKELEAREMRLLKGQGFRHILTYKGYEVETFPPHEMIGKPYYECVPPTWARLLMKIAFRMEDCPINQKRRDEGRLSVNMLLPWGQGEKIMLPNFSEKFGYSGAIICAAPIVKGIGRLAGLFTPDIEGANGELTTNYMEKVRVAIELSKQYDFVIVHLEAPDEMSHRGDIFGKVKAIAIADEMAGALSSAISELMIMTDHYTYCHSRAHGALPVPCIICNGGNGGNLVEDIALENETIEGSRLIKAFLDGVLQLN